MSESTSASSDQRSAEPPDRSRPDGRTVGQGDPGTRTNTVSRPRTSSVGFAFLLASGPLAFATMTFLDYCAVRAFREECRVTKYPGTLSLEHPYGLWLPIGTIAAPALSAVVAAVLLTRAVARPHSSRRYTAALLPVAALLTNAVLLLMTSNILSYYPGMDMSSPHGISCAKP
ncbi:hypothetical protein [Nocardia asiatica]|uniref:hypothetical protein n=1 Tax=Nocardia asiatica TaxID=209252 RepID=UPI002456CC2C|nr:hypothetical protein [Nocardia asiatica]